MSTKEGEIAFGTGDTLYSFREFYICKKIDCSFGSAFCYFDNATIWESLHLEVDLSLVTTLYVPSKWRVEIEVDNALLLILAMSTRKKRLCMSEAHVAFGSLKIIRRKRINFESSEKRTCQTSSFLQI